MTNSPTTLTLSDSFAFGSDNREIKFTYQHELITAAAVALNDRDAETLENLRLYLAGWLISDDERAALELLIDNMLELVWDLVD